MGRMNGKVAAITGGAGGIGGATVRRFLEEGAKIVFCDMNVEKGIAFEKELGTENAVFMAADVSKEPDTAKLVAETISRFGRLDVMVNNAAIRNYENVTEASEASWDRILGVNLKGCIFGAKAAITAMKEGDGGVVVNVASIRAYQAGSKTVQYDTSKAAILGLTRSMARDHAADNVRVMAVAPGPIFTDFHEKRADDADKTYEDYKAEFSSSTMLKRPAAPMEVANVILFVASDEASYMTASCVTVDGGELGLGGS